MTRSLMNVREVADYLSIKERKIYDLVARHQIPCTRVTGKWLFPKELIDLWLMHHAEGVPTPLPRTEPPTIISGSHDPLLDWAVRESASGLAVLFNGSLDGLEHFAGQQSSACGLHVLDSASGTYNTELLQRRFAIEPVVAIEWAWRQQGLMTAAGNPHRIIDIKDVMGKRFAIRQKEAGSHVLLHHLLQQAELTAADLQVITPPYRSETEVAAAIAAGDADVGLGIAAAAHQLRLDFIPIARERYDLLIWRRQYFEPPLQRLLAFAHSQAFKHRAETMGGYHIEGLGTVRYNGSG